MPFKNSKCKGLPEKTCATRRFCYSELFQIVSFSTGTLLAIVFWKQKLESPLFQMLLL